MISRDKMSQIAFCLLCVTPLCAMRRVPRWQQRKFKFARALIKAKKVVRTNNMVIIKKGKNGNKK